jgi:hypothetical protein
MGVQQGDDARVVQAAFDDVHGKKLICVPQDDRFVAGLAGAP